MPIGDSVWCTETELETVFPQFVTYTEYPHRPEQGVATMHKDMSLLKTYVTQRCADNEGLMRYTVKVFEIIKGKAHKLYELPVGTRKADSDLWKKRPKDRAVVVDEDEVAAAIASITGAS